MIRTFMVTISLAAPLVSAQHASTPSTHPAQTPTTEPTTTQPTPEQFHEQAYALMSAGKFNTATPLLNRAYNETPPAQRSRALVINRVILDLAHKQNLLRGIRDLSEHLARHPEPDEQASNVLGAALDAAADNAAWRSGTIYAAAFREFARREAALERRRPGLRRWGTAWITAEEFDALRQKGKAYAERLEAARAELEQRGRDAQARHREYVALHQFLREFATTHGHAKMNGGLLLPDCPKCADALQSYQTIDRLLREMRTDRVELQRLTRAYEALKRQPVKPDWPTRFNPIAPSATSPDPLPPAPPARAFGTTQPTTGAVR